MINKVETCGLAVDHNCIHSKDDPKPDFSGRLYDSQTVWYKLAGLGDYMRPIGQKVKESAASSAIDRMNISASDYKPLNLIDCLQKGGGCYTRTLELKNLYFDLSKQRQGLLRLIPLDRHDHSSSQANSLSFHLVQELGLVNGLSEF